MLVKQLDSFRLAQSARLTKREVFGGAGDGGEMGRQT